MKERMKKSQITINFLGVRSCPIFLVKEIRLLINHWICMHEGKVGIYLASCLCYSYANPGPILALSNTGLSSLCKELPHPNHMEKCGC